MTENTVPGRRDEDTPRPDVTVEHADDVNLEAPDVVDVGETPATTVDEDTLEAAPVEAEVEDDEDDVAPTSHDDDEDDQGA